MNNDYNEMSAGTDVVQALSMAVLENTLNKTFTQGISEASKLFVGRPHEQEAAIRNFIASFVPNILNQTNGDEAMREARTVSDALLSKTWMYNQVDPKRNVMGEVIVRSLPKWDPLGVTKSDVREVDQVLAEITRVAVADQTVGGAPSRNIAGPNKVDISKVPYSKTQSMYDRWQELTSTTKINGKTLREQLAETMNTSGYQRSSDLSYGTGGRGTKGYLIQKVIGFYRKKALSETTGLQELITSELKSGFGLLSGARQGGTQPAPLFPAPPALKMPERNLQFK